MRLILLNIILFLSVSASAQVIELQNEIATQKPVHDSLIRLAYFKNIDSILSDKIDSFDLYLSERKYELDSSYFYEVQIGMYRNKLSATIYYRSLYCDYLAIEIGVSKRGQRLFFSFSFYKNRLLLFSTSIMNVKLDEESKKLLLNMIYEHVNNSEKKMIDIAPDEYVIRTKPLKTYVLK